MGSGGAVEARAAWLGGGVARHDLLARVEHLAAKDERGALGRRQDKGRTGLGGESRGERPPPTAGGGRFHRVLRPEAGPAATVLCPLGEHYQHGQRAAVLVRLELPASKGTGTVECKSRYAARGGATHPPSV